MTLVPCAKIVREVVANVMIELEGVEEEAHQLTTIMILRQIITLPNTGMFTYHSTSPNQIQPCCEFLIS